ncbi:hypothetical protein Bca4012_059044 [Brassica carinata]
MAMRGLELLLKSSRIIQEPKRRNKKDESLGFAISRAELVIDLGSINYGVMKSSPWRICSVMRIIGSGKRKEDEPYESPLRRRRKLRKKKISAGVRVEITGLEGRHVRGEETK